jgi:hypothetical protein
MLVMFTKIEHIPARRDVEEGSSLSAVDCDQCHTTESEVTFVNTSLLIINNINLGQ